MKRLALAPVVLAAVAGALATVGVRPLSAWGEAGHRLTAEAAAAALPAGMPGFFRRAAPQLAYLNPEPDRWRDSLERRLDPALDQGAAADHFIDMEMAPPAVLASALAAPSRYAYLDTLAMARVDGEKMGLLPFRILELSQRLREEFRLWRSAPDDQVRAWIEQRIVNDAGILGHYVADGSNPMHTSIQYNGWTGPNPNGYATDRRAHSRFESAYVQTHIQLGDVQPLVGADARVLDGGDFRPAILAYLRESNSHVEQLYQLDRKASFGAGTSDPDDKRFVAQRLAAGARMLRDIWWTAWMTSAPGAAAAPTR